jgi:hypothetical protein
MNTPYGQNTFHTRKDTVRNMWKEKKKEQNRNKYKKKYKEN